MRMILATLALALCACSPATQSQDTRPDIELDVEPDVVAAGDSVTLELDNESDGAISYNLCSSFIEQRVGDAWEERPDDRVCTRELRVLPAGDEAHFRLQLPTALAPGEYRFRTGVQLDEQDAGTQIWSETFRVRE